MGEFVIVDDYRSDSWGLWLFGIVFSAIGFGSLWLVLHSTREGKLPVLIIVALFALSGLGFLFGAIRSTMTGRKFGEITCHLHGARFAVGETLRGDVRMRARDARVKTLRFDLDYYAITRGMKGSYNTRSLWRREWNVDPSSVSTVANELRIPFAQELTADIPSIVTTDEPQRVAWKLMLFAEFEDGDVTAQFALG